MEGFFNDFKTSGEANEGSNARTTLRGSGGMLPWKIFEFQMCETAISCNLRVKFMRRETKNCAIILEENNSLGHLPKFIVNQLCKCPGGRINATGWANTILGIYTY